MSKLKLSIIPPTNFDPLPGNDGFFLHGSDPNLGAPQIKATKFFLGYPDVKTSLLSDLGDASITEVLINNYEGIEIRQTLTEEGRSFTSLTLAFGNSTYSYVIVGVFPEPSTKIETIIKTSIETAYVDTFGYRQKQVSSNKVSNKGTSAGNQKGQLAAFGTIDVTSTGFLLAEIITDDEIAFTLDGAYPPMATDKSLLFLLRISATVSDESHIEYAKQIIMTNQNILSSSNYAHSNISIDGLMGIETTCDAKATNNTDLIKVCQVTLFDKDEVYVVLGISYLKDTDMVNKFKTVAKTFKKTLKSSAQ